MVKLKKDSENQNIVRIQSIQDLKLHKIKPSDLNKIYIDAQGQEYKLRYDPIKRKVIIVKVVKGVLDGKYVKTQYDKIAQDKKVETQVKYKIAEMGKEVFSQRYKISESATPTTPPPSVQQRPAPSQQKTEAPAINNLEDIFTIMEHTKERLKIAEKNIYDSNVLSEKYSYDDKIILDDISRLINSSILGEFQTAKERYEDILKGYDDTRLKSKLYNEKIKKIIESKPPEQVMNYLRELEIQYIFINAFETILKGYEDINYKVSTISQEKIGARTYHERQKFEDAMFLINICKKDAEKILEFLKKLHSKTIDSSL